MKTFIMTSAVVLFFTLLVTGQERITVNGSVTDENGAPLQFVNVYIKNTFDGAMTGEGGEFSFKTDAENSIILVASLVGYTTYEKELDASAGRTIRVNIRLESTTVNIETAVVTGSSFGTKEDDGIVINSYDIYTTPGGAADLFQSLKTMPGVINVSESAELYVRGGDPSETRTLINGTSLTHPYTYESSFGGLFSNLNTVVIKDMFFSSGGFSAKYGNVLSGVIDIESYAEPKAHSYRVGLSLASADLSLETPIIKDRLGFRLYGRQSFTEPLYWINGGEEEFSEAPVSADVNMIASYKYSGSGRIKLYGMYAEDDMGVNMERAEFDGVFSGNSYNRIFSLSHSDIIGKRFLITSSAGWSSFRNKWKAGIMNIALNDKNYSFRSDMQYEIRKGYKINFGGIFDFRQEHYKGVIPENDYNMKPDAQGTRIDALIETDRTGLYTELESAGLLEGALMFTAGIRTDIFSGINIVTVDPRINIGYQLGDNSSVKLGWGVFHQAPETRLFAPVDGNPDLKPMKAVHYILSYDTQFRNGASFRGELYYKAYSSLPLEDPIKNYNSSGYGEARGIDLIYKGTIWQKLTGWLSYSFINTERKWMDLQHYGRSSFDITHNVSIILKYPLGGNFETGINYKYSTGRPYTPVNDAVYLPAADVYQPIYGRTNSSRYKDYHRLDFRLMYFNYLFENYFTVFYLEALNIADINNIHGYTYSFDYSRRYDVTSYFGMRTIVFGFQIHL